MKILQIISILLSCCMYCHSANILAFATFPGYSHFVIMESVLKGLANKGHNVTVISYFPQKQPIKNYYDIDVSHTYPVVTNNISMDYVLKNLRPPSACLQYIYNTGVETCEIIFKEKAIQDLINTDDFKYDLVITEVFGPDCFTAIAHKFQIPFVSIATTFGFPWVHQRIANPDNPAYISNYFQQVKDQMTLYERFINALTIFIANTGYYYYGNIPSDKIVKKYFGESFPSLHEITKNVSLIMTNSHYSYRQTRPFLPNFIEIGGIHLKEPKVLPKDFQEILDNSENGVIVLALGSVLRFSTIPGHIKNAFVKTFAKLKQTIIWKIEDSLPDMPKNVITRKWIPLNDILHHPKVKLFITHGGMASTIEAVNVGVPVVGIPQFADQPGNIQGLVSKGTAVYLDYFDVTEESLYKSITEVLNEPRYAENAKKLSKIFKDRQSSPMDTATYWIEYVIRHKGAPHLKNPAVNMPWYQLMLLDVIFVALVILIFITILIYLLLIAVKRFLFGSFKNKRKQA